MKTLRGISLLSNSASSLSYFIHFILATCLPYHTIPPHDYSTNKKNEMTTSLTYKSYDQIHLTGLAAEYEMIAEYEAKSSMYDTSYYLDESHLPFLNNESHFFLIIPFSLLTADLPIDSQI